MGTKTVLSQTGSDNPTWGANPPTGTVLRTIHRNFGHYDNTAGSGVSSSSMTATSPTVCTDSNNV